MRYSVLIVNWRTSALLADLLRSLQQFPARGDHETIVVDNAGGDFDAGQFQREFPGVTFLPQTQNLGYAAGNNLAFRESTGGFIVLLNPDTQVTEGALERLLSFLGEHPRAGIAAPQLVYPGGRVQSSCRAFPWPSGILWAALRLPRLFPRSRVFGSYRMTWFDHKHTRQVDQPMASAWAVPRRAIQEIGFFDEDFPNLFNDVDWAWRAKRAGWEIWFVADAQVIHAGGQGTRQAARRLHRESHEGLAKFYKKHFRGHSSPAALLMALAISRSNCFLRIFLDRLTRRG